jgi:general secretion pathway protein C
LASLIHAIAPKLPILVTLGALGSIAAAAAPVAWHLGGWSAAMPEQPVAAAAVALPELEPVRIDPILDLSPFGVVEAPVAPDIPISETTLDLVLHGVVVQADPTASMAFIGHEGMSQGYRPDDMIADRARLVEVASDHVVLEVEGELQTLSFPEPGNAAPSAETGAATSGPDRLRELVAAQTQGGEASAPQDEGPQTTQDHIQLWRDRIRANPQEVLDAIGLIPTENGYRIAEQHDSGVGLAGLRAGDVVTSVNGQAVGDVEQDRTLFDSVAASGLARVEVQRDGRTIVMSFPLQ